MFVVVEDSPAVRSARRSEVTRPPVKREPGGTGPNGVKALRPDRKIPGHPRAPKARTTTQKDPDHAGSSLDLPVEPFDGVVRPDLAPVARESRGAGPRRRRPRRTLVVRDRR